MADNALSGLDMILNYFYGQCLLIPDIAFSELIESSKLAALCQPIHAFELIALKGRKC
jgi:hypothetical protein